LIELSWVNPKLGCIARSDFLTRSKVVDMATIAKEDERVSEEWGKVQKTSPAVLT
jgi:hypothetical protein